MRTTVDISDDVLAELKRLAVESHRTLKEIIEDALRADLSRRRAQKTPAESPIVITYKGRGVQPGVNFDSMSELLDIMEGTP